MTLEAADTGDSDGEAAAGDHDDDDEEDDEDGEAEDMEQFQESGLLDEVDPVRMTEVSAYCFIMYMLCDFHSSSPSPKTILFFRNLQTNENLSYELRRRKQFYTSTVFRTNVQNPFYFQAAQYQLS